MANVEPSSIEDGLAERRGFTSEIYKMELNGIPKFFGVNQVSAFCVFDFGLSCGSSKSENRKISSS